MSLPENGDEYDVKLLKQQSSSEECSENEIENGGKPIASKVTTFDDSYDSDDNDGMTMKVWGQHGQKDKSIFQIDTKSSFQIGT